MLKIARTAIASIPKTANFFAIRERHIRALLAGANSHVLGEGLGNRTLVLFVGCYALIKSRNKPRTLDGVLLTRTSIRSSTFDDADDSGLTDP